jgi:hypothetical protein
LGQLKVIYLDSSEERFARDMIVASNFVFHFLEVEGLKCIRERARLKKNCT